MVKRPSEESVVLTGSPQSLVAEGIAELAMEMSSAASSPT